MRGVCLLLFVVLAASPAAKAQQKPCSQAEENLASDSVDHLKDWNALYRSFKNFSNCDDGEVAEGYSDAVAKLLAKHWGELHVFIELSSKDKAFEQFAIRHIDSTDSQDDLDAIRVNAQKHCPSGQKRLCSLIGAEVKAANSQ